MSQQVQELIDKIKTEGVQTAEKQAKEIVEQAQAAAEKEVASAKTQAQQIVAAAEVEAQKNRESTEMALRQSARDTLLALRKEIENTLQKIITTEVKAALTSDQLTEVLKDVITRAAKEGTVEISLSEDDLKKVRAGFAAKLQKEIKQPITFKSDDGITSGFTISFDEGKSCFDFTEASLTAYLSNYLNERIAEFLKE